MAVSRRRYDVQKPANAHAQVTHAKLAWDGVGPRAKIGGGSSSLYSRVEVQRITTYSRYRDLQGSFKLAFENHATGPLPHDAAADVVEEALEALAPVGDVTVTREEVGYGHAWYVTFEAAAGADDATRARMTYNFRRACDLEWMFWKAALDETRWPTYASAVPMVSMNSMNA